MPALNPTYCCAAVALCLFFGVMNGSPAAAQSDSSNAADDFYQLELTYTGDMFANTTGGNDTGIRYMDNVDITVTLDLQQPLGLPNSELYVYGLGNQGGNLTSLRAMRRW